MSNEATSGANQEGAQSPNLESDDQVKNTDSQSVPESTEADERGYPAHFVEKLKKEQSNWRAKAKELEAQLKQRQESELKEQNKYKELFEARTQELAAARTELTGYQEKMKHARKLAAVSQELQKLGIRPGKEQVAYKLMDLTKVAIDEDTETVIGADQVAKSFYEENADLGIWGKPSPRVSHAAASSDATPHSISDLSLDQKLKMLAELELKNPNRRKQ